MNGWELAALLLAWGLGGGSPGPATLTISGTAMARGRIAGVVSGFGIVCGSAVLRSGVSHLRLGWGP